MPLMNIYNMMWVIVHVQQEEPHAMKAKLSSKEYRFLMTIWAASSQCYANPSTVKAEFY